MKLNNLKIIIIKKEILEIGHEGASCMIIKFIRYEVIN